MRCFRGWLICLTASPILAGCRPAAAPNPVRPPSNPPVAAVPPAIPVADLSRPISPSFWMGGSQAQEPLDVARGLSEAAGGTWVALAPRPLEMVAWTANRESPPTSVEAALNALPKAGARVSWERQGDRILLYFGTKTELAAAKRKQADEVVGFYVRAPTGALLLKAIGDVLKLRIEAAPEVYRPREKLIAGAAARAEAMANLDGQSEVMRFAMRMQQGGGETDDTPPALELLVADRTDIPEFLKQLGSYLVADVRQGADGAWRLSPLKEPARIAQEIGRLEEVIKSTAAETADTFSSFGSRQVGGSPEGEDATAIAPLPREAMTAFEGLALLGKQAVPTLTAHLDPEKPAIAAAAIAAMAQMTEPAANTALIEFAGRLTGKLEGKPAQFQKALRRTLIGALAAAPTEASAAWLADVARAPGLSAVERRLARIALLAAGQSRLLIAGMERKEILPAGLGFKIQQPSPSGVSGTGGTVSRPTAESAPPSALNKQGEIIPLATNALPSGEIWGLIVSDRLGSSQDVWLAHSKRGRWDEVLFTGQAPARTGSPYGGRDQPLTPGSVALRVKGDRVEVLPANQGVAAELAKLQQLFKKLQNQPELYQKYTKEVQRYSQLMQQTRGGSIKPLTLSLQELRKDADRDGVTDLVEKRLGTDPKKPDTDGDGTPDGRDGNPRVSSAASPASPGGRAELLQQVFAALFGRDPSTDPILVVLEKPYWQEFHGASGCVICIGKDELRSRFRELRSIRTLEFGGPLDEAGTVLKRDGPVLLAQDGSRAEVHFWDWGAPSPPREADPYAGMSGMSSPTEMTALFERTGAEWKLTSCRRRRWHDVTRSQMERATYQMGDLAAGGFRDF